MAEEHLRSEQRDDHPTRIVVGHGDNRHRLAAETGNDSIEGPTELKARYAVYSSRFAVSAWVVAAYLLALFGIVDYWRQELRGLASALLLLFFGAIPSVTVLPMLGIAAIAYGILDRHGRSSSYGHKAVFGILTGCLTILWAGIVVVFCCNSSLPHP
jgi:hypothetical protein